jgi:hypothetical protein
MLGFKSFEAAQCTVAGVELMHMLKKGQLVVEEGAEGLTLVEICLKAKVMLPRVSKRSIMIQDLPVGLTVELNDTALELDLIPEQPTRAEEV